MSSSSHAQRAPNRRNPAEAPRNCRPVRRVFFIVPSLTAYIWFPHKTPHLSECPYNAPLHEVHKQFLGHDLGQFPFLLGVLYRFRITSQTSRRSEEFYTAAGGCARGKIARRMGRFEIRRLMEIPVIVCRISLDGRPFRGKICIE